ncbi:MAG: ion transporter [Alphaproteobacteria bacterium]|nr:ion transporter [Alphaproteobacteria bacterium]
MASLAEKMAAAGQPEARTGGLRFLQIVTESWIFKNFILLCILINAVALGVDAHFGESNPWHHIIEELDTIFLAIFTAELVLEFIAQGPRRYVRDGWNIFDCIVVGVSYISMAPAISALRTLRVLRVLRLVSNVPQMRRVVEALIGATPGILATTMVLAVVFYIGAVMATTLFGERFPDEFGDLAKSSLLLFQLTLFDDWGATVAKLNTVYPWAWIFILGFTILSAFAVLNLFIGVIVDAVQETRTAEQTEAIKKEVDQIDVSVEELSEAQSEAQQDLRIILKELKTMRAELAALRPR